MAFLWRWTVRIGFLLLLALALFVLGRGLGWLPSGGGDGAKTGANDGSGPPPPEQTAALPRDSLAALPAAPPGPGSAVAKSAEGSAATEPRPAPHEPAPGATTEGARSPAAPPPVQERAAPSVPPATEPSGADDRSTSLLSLARSALEAGRPGTAFATLAELDHLQLGAPQMEQARALRQLAQAGLEVETAALVTDVRSGRILAARRRLAELLHERAPAAVAAVDAAAQAAGWPALSSTAKGKVYLPKAAPLAKERLVRTVRDGRELQARVVDARPHEVTLKVVDGRAMTFPSFPVTKVEPVDATAAEAVELGLAALAADDVTLARLWLCAAVAAGAGGARLQELRLLLP